MGAGSPGAGQDPPSHLPTLFLRLFLGTGHGSGERLKEELGRAAVPPPRLEFNPSGEGGVGRRPISPLEKTVLAQAAQPGGSLLHPSPHKTCSSPELIPPFKSPGIWLEAQEPGARLSAGDGPLSSPPCPVPLQPILAPKV